MAASDQYAPVQRTGDEFDIFISHASEDKDAVVRPLTKALTQRGLRVWLDEQELTLGDVLGRKIDEGLAKSRFGVVVLSKDFFARHWPRRELDGLVARETLNGDKVILPVWHGVTAAEVGAQSPTLAARLAVDTARGIEHVADQVQRALDAATSHGGTIVHMAVQAGQPQPDAGVTTGDDGGALHDAVLDLLRKDDTIGLDEVLRAERNAFERAVDAVTDDYINAHLDENTIRDAGGRLAAAAQRRLASLIPLGLHRPRALERELRAHAGWMSRTQPRAGGATWQEAWRLPWWIAGMALGGLLCRFERYEAVGELVGATWLDRYNQRESFIGHPGEVGDAVAELLGPAPPQGRRWALPAGPWLAAELRAYHWLAERYPEWLASDNEPEAALAEFDLIDGIAEAFRSGDRVVALWSLELEAASAFARRLYGDAAIRAEVAQAVGADPETFDARAPEILARAHGLGMFPRTQEVANILRTGSLR